MLSKAMVAPASAAFLVLIFLSLLLLLLSPNDIRSQFFSSTTRTTTTQSSSSSSSCMGPLRVYMYDLPRRFNLGMLEGGGVPDGILPDPSNLPPWPKSSSMKRQHSVEYWLMASLLLASPSPSSDARAVRVRDPLHADAFFVPFFSSLSFNTHGHSMTDPATKLDRQLQVDLLDFLGRSEHWRRSGGRDHVIPMTHPNAFRFLREQVNASILIVADFGRYPRNVSSLRKDVVAPYVHVVDSYLDDDPADPYGSRQTLLFFRGRTVRKADGIVRKKLANILKGEEGVIFEDSYATGDGIKASTEGMRTSKFCLHPAGDTPSSCRLFDAIVSHCLPVVVSDRIELPFEDEINYSDFSIFFSFMEALQPGYMVGQLRKIPKERWVEMWRRLKNVSYHYEFQYPPKRSDAVNMLWTQVQRKLPAVNLAVHRSGRLKIPDWWNQG